MKNIVYPELSYLITGLCFQVHRKLDRFCREKQYADYLEQLLEENNINYRREFEVKNLEPHSPEGNRADFLIDDKIVVDIKAKRFITKSDYFQMQRYLKSGNLELGLIVNFRASHLKPKRVLNSRYVNSGHSDVLVD